MELPSTNWRIAAVAYGIVAKGKNVTGKTNADGGKTMTLSL